MEAKVSYALSRYTFLLTCLLTCLLATDPREPQKQPFYCLLSASCHISLASNIYFSFLISMANYYGACILIIELAVVFMLLLVLDKSSSLPVLGANPILAMPRFCAAISKTPL